MTAIDISTFIWCEQDFKNNTIQYYKLLGSISSVYSKIKELRLSVLFRSDLQDLIWAEFPYNLARNINPDFEISTLKFLTETFSNWIIYHENNDILLTTVPDLRKPHLNCIAKIEFNSQMSYILNNEANYKFISFSYFYTHDKNLLITREDKQKEIETLIYTTDIEVIKFFDNYKIKFEHNPKHTNRVRFVEGEKVSPFTCFHQKDGLNKAQKLLEEALMFQDDYYNFDVDNGVFVKFVLTIDLTYHGFDLSDENNIVPNEVKKKFNKNGRTF